MNMMAKPSVVFKWKNGENHQWWKDSDGAWKLYLTIYTPSLIRFADQYELPMLEAICSLSMENKSLTDEVIALRVSCLPVRVNDELYVAKPLLTAPI